MLSNQIGVSALGAVLLVVGVVDVRAGLIDAVSVTNNSTADGATVDGSFFTSSTVGPVTNVGNVSAFTQRMAFVNAYTASGGVAQTHREIVNFDLMFTVEDPGLVGYSVMVDSLMRGVSSITQLTTLGNQAVATGADFFVEEHDSTMSPGTFVTLIGLFHNTPGVSVIGPGSQTQLQESMIGTGLGGFVGTKSFILRLNSLFTPATNVIFQNGEAGTGSVNYGIGGVPVGVTAAEADLGNFLTVTATFVPEPSTMVLAPAAVVLTAARPRRRSVH